MKYVNTLALLFVILAAFAQERIGLDPVLRGVWNVYCVSDDDGETIKWLREDKEPVEFALARATSITFSDGKKVNIDKVVVSKDKDGNPANLVSLENGNILAISKQPGQALVLVQLYKMDDEGEMVEDSRMIMAVLQD